MWRLIDRLLGLILITAFASTLFVFASLASSWWLGLTSTGREAGLTVSTLDPVTSDPAPTHPKLEIRVASHGNVSRVFTGQPLAFDVVLLNLETSTGTIALDDETTPWEQRVVVTLTTSDGTVLLGGFSWHARLLNRVIEPSHRVLGVTPARLTFILDGVDLASLTPGPHVINASLPPEIVGAEVTRIIPLRLDIAPPPTTDADRAIVNLAIAEVAALRGDTIRAIDAAKTALALDPLQDRALTIVAESYEAEGDLVDAVAWYERYLETLDAEAGDYRQRLEAYIDALRRQL